MSPGVVPLRSSRSGLSRLDIYERIRTDIIDNVLEPGSAIPEASLVQRYGAGRSPLREALMRLGAEGLVQIVPQVGTFVTPLDLADMDQAITVRGLLEFAAASACARVPDQVLTTSLSRTVAMQRVALEHADFAALLRLDTEFHQSIVTAGIGAIAWRVVSQMRGLFLRVRNLSVPDPATRAASVEQHATIAAAIARHDAAEAERQIRRHTQANHEQLQRLQAQHPDFFQVSRTPPSISERSP